jgi:hypothetical protein
VLPGPNETMTPDRQRVGYMVGSVFVIGVLFLGVTTLAPHFGLATAIWALATLIILALHAKHLVAAS